MPRARRRPRLPGAQPEPPMMPVEWIDNAAQNAGCIVEVVKSDRGTRSKRRHRLHMVELLGKTRRLSERQVLAGVDLLTAWHATQLSAPAIPELRVDTTPRPDSIAVAQCEAMQAYADLMAVIPALWRPAVRRVVCDGMMPASEREMVDVQQGLSRLADHKRY